MADGGDRKLRWGILSTARICRRLLPPLQRSEHSELIGVASRSPEKAREFARRWEIPRIWDSYEALLSDSAIDVVYVPLPNHLHCHWTIEAANSGKHVLCEKPLGLSPAEVDRMAVAAERAGVVLLEGFQFRFHPLMKTIQQTLQDCDLGPVSLVKGHFSFALEDTQNIRLDKEAGGGSLWDIGCYPVCFMQAILGPFPLEVFAWQTPGPTGVDVAMAGQLRYSTGAIGQFDCSFQTPYRVGAEVVCRNGRIILEDAWRAGISGNSRIQLQYADHTQTVTIPEADPFECEVGALEGAVLRGDEPPYSVEDSRYLVRTLSALYRSADSGRPVFLSEVEPR